MAPLQRDGHRGFPPQRVTKCDKRRHAARASRRAGRGGVAARSRIVQRRSGRGDPGMPSTALDRRRGLGFWPPSPWRPRSAGVSSPRLRRSRRRRVRHPPGSRTSSVVVEPRSVNITGQTREAMAINGTIPGPLLRFQEGEDVVISVANRLDETTSLHWHGLIIRHQRRLPGHLAGNHLHLPPADPAVRHHAHSGRTRSASRRPRPTTSSSSRARRAPTRSWASPTAGRASRAPSWPHGACRPSHCRRTDGSRC